MENLKINYAKKLAKLRYKDVILQMHLDGISLRKIAQKINYRLARTSLKVEISKSTIDTIIKKYKKKD